MCSVPLWASLGAALGPDVASFFALLAFLCLSWPHSWSLLASRSLSERIFFDFSKFFQSWNLPEPQKPMKNHWFSEVFCNFRILLKMTENLPKMLPKWSQKAFKTVPNPSKILPRRPKIAPRRLNMDLRRLQDALWHSRTHPRHAPDAPKTRQDCPRHVRTTQKSLQDLSKIRFLRVWGLKNKYFE